MRLLGRGLGNIPCDGTWSLLTGPNAPQYAHAPWRLPRPTIHYENMRFDVQQAPSLQAPAPHAGDVGTMTVPGAFDFAAVAQGIRQGRLHWGRHVLERMAQRDITRADVLTVLRGGELVEEYLDDDPYPSALVPGFVAGRPLHVVVALDVNGPDPYIITVYQPNPDKFESDWKTRRQR